MNRTLRSAVATCFALWLASSCTQAVTDDKVESNAEALSTPLDVDFSSYPLGALGSPWTVVANGHNSTATVINSTAAHGKAMLVHVEPADGESLTASLPMSVPDADIDVQFQVNPGAKSNFEFTLSGTKTGYRSSRFSLQRVPGSKEFTISSMYPHSDCGTLPDNVWSTVSFKLRNANVDTVIDVLINGVMKAECSGISTSTIRAPFTGIGILEYFDFGTKTSGNVTFDNFNAQTGVAN